MTSSPRNLSRISIGFHWAVAITMIGLVLAGFTMKYLEVWFLYPIHKSIGILALLIIVPRVLWRLKEGWPTPASEYQRHEQILSKSVHWVLIIATVAMPLSGLLLSGASGHGFGIFQWELFPANHSLENPDEVIAFSESGYALGAAIHQWVGFILAASVVLHIAGALKHHFMDKDGTLRRMLGRSVD